MEAVPRMREGVDEMIEISYLILFAACMACLILGGIGVIAGLYLSVKREHRCKAKAKRQRTHGLMRGGV